VSKVYWEYEEWEEWGYDDRCGHVRAVLGLVLGGLTAVIAWAGSTGPTKVTVLHLQCPDCLHPWSHDTRQASRK
jgi:hypothetical protein